MIEALFEGWNLKFWLILVISSRVEKSGPFRTRFRGIFFSRGTKWIQGGKNTPEEQKKRVRKAGPLSKRGAESALF